MVREKVSILKISFESVFFLQEKLYLNNSLLQRGKICIKSMLF